MNGTAKKGFNIELEPIIDQVLHVNDSQVEFEKAEDLPEK